MTCQSYLTVAAYVKCKPPVRQALSKDYLAVCTTGIGPLVPGVRGAEIIVVIDCVGVHIYNTERGASIRAEKTEYVCLHLGIVVIINLAHREKHGHTRATGAGYFYNNTTMYVAVHSKLGCSILIDCKVNVRYRCGAYFMTRGINITLNNT